MQFLRSAQYQHLTSKRDDEEYEILSLNGKDTSRQVLETGDDPSSQCGLASPLTKDQIHGHKPLIPNPQPAESQLQAWKKSIRYITLAVSILLCFNIATTIGLVLRFGASEGVSTLLISKCKTVAKMDLGLHLAINALSTGIVLASNYVMQCLNAPPRKQVDEAHAKESWLYIGLPSIRNATRVGWKKGLLWLFLGISAIPLSLFWNSAFFSTTYAHQYQIMVVANDFDTTTDFKCDLIYGCDTALELYNQSKLSGAWERLDNAECIQTYSSDFLAGRRNMIAVSTSNIAAPPRSPYDTVINGSVFGVLNSSMYDYSLNLEDSWHPNGWYCLDIQSSYSPSFIDSVWSEDINGCRMSDALAHAANLTVVVPGFGPYNIYMQSNGFVYEIDYCLSQVVSDDKECELNFVPYIMVIVVVCNAIKVICIALSYYTFSDPPLVLIGDAVASFLERRDLSTIDWRSMGARIQPGGDRISRSKQKNMRLWLQAPSLTSLLRCLLLCLAILSTIAYLLAMSISTLKLNGLYWQDLDFGTVNAISTISSFLPNLPANSFTVLAAAVFFANSPQLIYTTLYFMYNRLLTTMASMDEWSRFEFKRRPLRVSKPSRGQRSSYYLHLSFKYSIPLGIASFAIHFCISQSIFLARIKIFDTDGSPYRVEQCLYSTDKITCRNQTSEYIYLGSSLVTTVGYSPKAILVSIMLGVVMIGFLLALGVQRYPGVMPFIGNNSRVISAACHPPQEDIDHTHSSLIWGAVQHGNEEDVMGRCCFTSLDVETPLADHLYAGL